MKNLENKNNNNEKSQKMLFKVLSITGALFFVLGNAIGAYQGLYNLFSGSLICTGAVLMLSIIFQVEKRNLTNYINLFFFCFFILGSFGLIYQIANNHQISWDVTKKKTYSLSPQSVKFMQGLDQQIDVTIFTQDFREADEFMKKYKKHTEFLKYKIFDPVKDAMEAKAVLEEFGSEVGNNDIIIKAGKKKKKIRGFVEEGFTNAVVEVLREENLKAYFLIGHGEKSIDSSQSSNKFSSEKKKDPSISLLVGKIEERGIQIEKLNIMEKGYIPQDCKLLICAGPQIDFFPAEAAAIKKFMDNKGRGIFMIDPVEVSNVEFTNIQNLFAQFGVKLTDDIVIDIYPLSSGISEDPFSPLINQYNPEHVITKDLKEMNFIAPKTRTVEAEPGNPSNLSVTPLMYSSKMSWSESIKNILSTKKITQPEDRARVKPQSLAAAVIKFPESGKEEDQTRMVVFGDSDMFSNDLVVQQVPAILFYSSLHWLTAKEDLIAIPPKTFEETPITVSASKYLWLYMTLVVLLPGVIFFGGLGYTMMRRKSK